MNKAELQKILKPLILEAVKEVMFESGVLSQLITEVATGLNNTNKVVIKEIIREHIPSTTELAYEPMVASRKREIPQEMSEKVSKAKNAVRAAAMEKQRSMELNERFKKVTDAAGMGIDIFKGIETAPLIQEAMIEKSPTAAPEESKMESQGTALRNIDPRDPGVNIKGILNVAGHRWAKVL